MSAATEQQPASTASEGEAVWPRIFDSTAIVIPGALREAMKERHQLGLKRYGVALHVWNGRDPIVDAYQEALDLLVYVQQARERLGTPALSRRGGGHGDLRAQIILARIFMTALQAADDLRELAELGLVPKHPPLKTK